MNFSALFLNWVPHSVLISLHAIRISWILFLYMYVRYHTKCKSGTPSLLENDNLLTTDTEKLMPLQTILPLYMLKITNLYQSLILDGMAVSTILHVQCINHFTCNVLTMIKIVKKLKPNASPGPDMVTPCFFKMLLLPLLVLCV